MKIKVWAKVTTYTEEEDEETEACFHNPHPKMVVTQYESVKEAAKGVEDASVSLGEDGKDFKVLAVTDEFDNIVPTKWVTDYKEEE